MGLRPFFCLGGRTVASVEEEIEAVIEPAVSALGYELVGVEFQQERGGYVLRAYIDSPHGVTVDDCAHVSYQVSGVLDVEDPVQERYQLEISSPGLDRPLFKARDYERFAGQRAQLRLQELWHGRRKLTGTLRGTEGDNVCIEVEGQEFRVPLAMIRRARLVPDL